MMRYALVRPPGPDAVQGLTVQTGPPTCLTDLAQQHAAYCRLLRTLGVELIRLDPLPGFPDAYFVEDTAVVTPEIAVITRPGAPERQGEVQTVARVLSKYRELKVIDPPGTLDGGDVMIVNQQIFIGLSGRTNRHGANQLARILTPFGYRCTAVDVRAGLHLKSNVAPVNDRQLLILASWGQMPAFDGYDKLLVDPSEAHACNTLALNGHLIIPAGYPRTLALLETCGQPILTLDTRPFHRMDGGLTCLSLRF
jgi:dimethylargininase